MYYKNTLSAPRSLTVELLLCLLCFVCLNCKCCLKLIFWIEIPDKSTILFFIMGGDNTKPKTRE